ncbi:MAG: hypothetical protein NUV52_01865 [Candidatus Roizmanbacteria bacterium]|nr:hypothetical protein [Candidatus Roizmanbacteria bacterium]
MRLTKRQIIIGIVVVVLGILFFPHADLGRASKNKVMVRDAPLMQKTAASAGVGFVGPTSCATVAVTVSLNAADFAALINSAKPVSVLLYDIRLEARSGEIGFSLLSAYPFLPGNISGTIIPQGRHISVVQAYVGSIPVSDNLKRRIESMANPYLYDSLFDQGFKLGSISSTIDNITVSGYMCPGLITFNADGTITIDKSVVK